ncbi:MAG: acyl carrier protein [Acetobacteraceae bacterium]|nr:acyl carrier protein [Acetobacteraceae bacterium]
MDLGELPLPHEPITVFLREALKRKWKGSGRAQNGITDQTSLLEAGVIDSMGLLDIILEVEESYSCVFDPESLDLESGVTLAKLASAFVKAS